MSLILGIDTGGTFTDSVIYDNHNNMILSKSKAFTTPNNLLIGVRNSLNQLDHSILTKVKSVTLSTTLATNAIIEGKGSNVGLILIGKHINKPLPTTHYKCIKGGHNIFGEEKGALDIEELKKAADELSDKVESFAISGYFSVRNPEHELIARNFIHRSFNKPIICSHQLTSKLGFYERTVTSVLNAKLLPLIDDLIIKTKQALNEFDISVPLMILKGDGSLVNEQVARFKPVNTILSGPTSSLIGAKRLVDKENAIILDMGGTTTDISIIENGSPRNNDEGAKVGKWFTRVKSPLINTYGIGGDSLINIKSIKKIYIGPEKVMPFCKAVSLWPHLESELKDQFLDNKRFYYNNKVEAYHLMKKGDLDCNSEWQKRVVMLLQGTPHTLYYLHKTLGANFDIYCINDLLEKGIIKKIALTPTDIIHCMGKYTEYDEAGSVTAVGIISKLINSKDDIVINAVYEKMITNISSAIIDSLLNYEGNVVNLEDKNTACFINKILASNHLNKLLNIKVDSGIPIIAIGAPAKAYIEDVSKKLNCQLHIPKDYEVANAVGSATANISEKIIILIRKDEQNNYIVYTPINTASFASLKDAKNHAMDEGNKIIHNKISQLVTHEYQVTRSCNDYIICTEENKDEKIFIESTIEISAQCDPR